MTIVAILLALLLIGIAIAVFTSGLRGHLKANRQLRSGDSATEVETLFKEHVHDAVANFVEDTLCGQAPSTPAAFKDIDWSQISPSLDVSWIKGSSVGSEFSYTGDAAHSAAIARCSSNQTFSSGDEKFPDAGQIYFCLRLAPSQTASSNVLGFFGNPARPVLAELSFSFWNVLDGQSDHCEDVVGKVVDGVPATSGIYSRALRMFYAFYWRGGQTGSESYFHVTSLVHAKSHD